MLSDGLSDNEREKTKRDHIFTKVVQKALFIFALKKFPFARQVCLFEQTSRKSKKSNIKIYLGMKVTENLKNEFRNKHNEKQKIRRNKKITSIYLLNSVKPAYIRNVGFNEDKQMVFFRALNIFQPNI
jgi:hypothetical protein